MDRWEIFYGIGKLLTFKLKFENDGRAIEEYIHCEVLEWTKTDKFDRPTEIKIRQIRNLQEFFSGRKLSRHERILEVKNIEPVDFIFERN